MTAPGSHVHVAGREPLHAGLRTALEHVDWTRLVPRGARVAVKPNYCWPEPLDGVTTAPATLDAVLGALASRTAHLAVVESDGAGHAAEDAFQAHDAAAICARHGARLVNLSRLPREPRTVTVGGAALEVELPSMLLHDVDVLVTLANLKTHVITTVSLGLKNLWGCLPSSRRVLSHPVLEPGIVALARLLRPALTIIDGTFALDRRGPVFGDAVPVGRLVVSADPVAADAVACRLLGIDPARIPHIRLAAAERLGELEPRVTGDARRPAHVFGVRPTWFDRGANVTYRWSWLVRLVHGSALTPAIYSICRRHAPMQTEAARAPLRRRAPAGASR